MAAIIMIVGDKNTGRSVMAEGILRDILKKGNHSEEFTVKSMGITAFDGQDPIEHSVTCLQENFITIGDKQSERIALEDVYSANMILTMTTTQQQLLIDILPESEESITVLGVEPLASGDIESYRQAYQSLEGALQALPFLKEI